MMINNRSESKQNRIIIILLILFVLLTEVLIFNEGFFENRIKGTNEFSVHYLDGTLNGFEVHNNALISQHIDPNITFPNLNDELVHQVDLYCSSTNPYAISQIYYRRDEVLFSEENSIIFILEEEGTSVELPRLIRLSNLRFDLTNKKNDAVTCAEIIINPSSPFRINYFRILLLGLLLLWLILEKRVKSIIHKLLGWSVSRNNGLWVLAFLHSTLLFLVFFAFFTPTFQTNDDVAMMNIASGLLSGQPSEYLIFINVIYGLLLKFIYQLFPAVNWYVISFYAIHFISMTTLFVVLLRKKTNLFNFFLFLLIFVIFEIPMLAELQFTTTAAVAGSVGLLTLVGLVVKRQKYDWALLFIGSSLLIISGLIRSNVFILVVIIIFPLFLFITFKAKDFNGLIWLFLIIGIFIFTQALHQFYYQQDPGWAHYLDYNPLRAQLTDYPYSEYNEKTQHVYEEVGWSENDVAIMRNWLFFDQVKYNIHDLDYVVENITPLDNTIEDTFDTLVEAVKKVYNVVLLFIILTIYVIVFGYQSKNNINILLLIFLGSAIVIYLSFVGRLPLRVLFSILFLVAIFISYFTNYNEILIPKFLKLNFLSHSSKIYITKLFILFLMLLNFYNYINHNHTVANQYARRDIDKMVTEFSSTDYIFAVHAGYIYGRDLRISFNNDFQFLTHFVNLGGWTVPSPIFYDDLEKLSLVPTYLSLFDNDLLFIVPPGRFNLLKTFMCENYQLNVGFQEVLSSGGIVASKMIEDHRTNNCSIH